MLTPNFFIKQEEDFLVVTIRAPFAKLDDAEVSFDGLEFLFSCKPYFLRLHLPKRVIENGKENARYVPDDSCFVVRVPKATAGEPFEGLDLITDLLTPKGTQSAQKLIENFQPENESLEQTEENQADDDCNYQWFLEQKLCENEEIENDTCGYGFANKRHGVFTRLQEEISLLVEIENPDTTDNEQRLELCQQMEKDKFDPDYYLADLQEPDDPLQVCLNFHPGYITREGESVWMTEEERDIMKDLPRRQYEYLDSETISTVLISLVDIIFGYAYDMRTTQGEHSVESGWTIAKLSPTLSCLVTHSDMKQTLLSCVRRCLALPIYRNWELATRAIDDVKKVFKMGKYQLLKCVLDIREVLNTSGQYRYILNDLYVTDYCVWLQRCPDSAIESCSSALEQVEISKDELDLDLESIELVGRMAQLECNGEEKNKGEIDTAEQLLHRVHCALDSDDERC